MVTRYNRRDFLKLGVAAGTTFTITGLNSSGCSMPATKQQPQQRPEPAHKSEPSIWETIKSDTGLSQDQTIEKLLSQNLLHPSNKVDYSIWLENADHYCNHEFDLHNSGWIKVCYGMKAPGFEGYNYSDTSITFEKAFEQLPEYYKSASREIIDNIKKLNPSYQPIDWQMDIKSGYRYGTDKHFSQIQYGIVPGNDLKVAAEISRGYQLTTLAIAYKHIKNSRYAAEIICQMLDWFAMNPVGMGVAWWGIMNVSIRTANWLAAISLIRDYLKENLTNPQIQFFFKSYLTALKNYGEFLMSNLELPETSIHPNHYIANITALLMVAAATRGLFKDSDKWVKFASREIANETRRQVLADGMDFECATGYQAFALEMFAYSAIIAANSDPKFDGNYQNYLQYNFGIDYVATLEKMASLLAHVHKPTGHIPIAGDYDSGRLIKLDPLSINELDRRPVAFVVFTMLDKNLAVTPPHTAAARLLLGDEVVDKKFDSVPESASQAFTTSGYYLMRDRDNHCFISCGPIGTGGKGGHAHNDKLAFELTLAGKEIFIDPGVYTYTALLEIRNATRTTRNHNTIMIADQEQNRYASDSKWWGCLEETRCRCIHWETTAKKDTFIGEHFGYEKLTPSIVHRREISLHKQDNKVEIIDELFTESAPTGSMPQLEWNFILHPDCTVAKKLDGTIEITNGNVKAIFTLEQGQAEITDAFFCPSYGKRLPSKRIKITSPFIAKNKFNINWQIGPVSSRPCPYKFSMIPGNNPAPRPYFTV